jgi:hypothetical protein
MFNFFRILSTILVIYFLVLNCENATEPQEDDNYFKGITETDENGNLIGNFDFDDWTLLNRYFGNKIEIAPQSLYFKAISKGQEVSNYIKFKNHYATSYKLVFNNLNPPFSISQLNIALMPDQTDSVAIKFVLPDTLDISFKDSLEIRNDSNEKVIYNLSGYWHNPNPNDSSIVDIRGSIPLSYSFLPAYPNPAVNSIVFRYTNISRNTVNLKIVDQQKNTIKVLVNNMLQPAGSYSVTWDLKDSDGNKVSPSIYRAELDINGFHSHGDIKIE